MSSLPHWFDDFSEPVKRLVFAVADSADHLKGVPMHELAGDLRLTDPAVWKKYSRRIFLERLGLDPTLAPPGASSLEQ